MIVTVDTNVLARSIVRDDVRQARIADRTLQRATRVIVTVPCLCELVWVLNRSYGFSREDIATTLEALLDIANISVAREAVKHGVTALRAGGDFADGAIAHEGRQLGAELFVSFDRKAVRLISAQGYQAELL